MNNKIRWIFFDVGNVLIDDSHVEKVRIDLITEVAKVYVKDLATNDVKACLPKASAMLGGLNKGMLKCLIKDDRQYLKAITDLDLVKSKLFHEHEVAVVRAEAKNVLEKISKKYKLGLIANQPISVKERLKNAGIYQYFAHDLVSDDHNLAKPDPKYFKAVLKHTGAHPVESAYVEDNIERGLIPAKNIGMMTVWYKTSDRKEYPKSSVDHTINSLEDLLNIF